MGKTFYLKQVFILLKHTINKMSLNPLPLIKAAIKAVPAVKYALGLAGIVAVLYIILTFRIDPSITLWGTLCIFFLMFVLLLFAKISENSPKFFNGPGKMVIYAVSFLFVLALTFLLTTTFFKWPQELRSILQRSKVDVVVFLKYKDNQQIELPKDGSIAISLNKRPPIKKELENGKITLYDLEIGDVLSFTLNTSEKYLLAYPDSSYVITSNKIIEPEIILDGIDQVKGHVVVIDSPLKEVKVSIDSLSTFTDDAGFYKIHIPRQMQKKGYMVWFKKDGFKIVQKAAHPGSDTDMSMEKNTR